MGKVRSFYPYFYDRNYRKHFHQPNISFIKTVEEYINSYKISNKN